jgi:hypothetical protein
LNFSSGKIRTWGFSFGDKSSFSRNKIDKNWSNERHKKPFTFTVPLSLLNKTCSLTATMAAIIPAFYWLGITPTGNLFTYAVH